jgi:hypothetical protein
MVEFCTAKVTINFKSLRKFYFSGFTLFLVTARERDSNPCDKKVKNTLIQKFRTYSC